jgi:hypothetical protein
MVVIFKDIFPFSKMTKNDTNDQKVQQQFQKMQNIHKTYFEISKDFPNESLCFFPPVALGLSSGRSTRSIGMQHVLSIQAFNCPIFDGP